MDPMRDDSQATTSIWMATANPPSQSRLKESIRTDICIIGSGIAGVLLTDLIQGRENTWEGLYRPRGAIKLSDPCHP